MMRFVLSLGLMLVLAVGCNSSDGGGGGGTNPDPGNSLVEVKSGTWAFSIIVGQNPALTDRRVLCGTVDLNTLAANFGIICETSVSGTQLVTSCNGETTLAGCLLGYAGSGTGKLGQNFDSVQITNTLTVTVKEGDPEVCGTGTTTVPVTLTGSWISDEGCSGASNQVVSLISEELAAEMEALIAAAWTNAN